MIQDVKLQVCQQTETMNIMNNQANDKPLGGHCAMCRLIERKDKIYEYKLPSPLIKRVYKKIKRSETVIQEKSDKFIKGLISGGCELNSTNVLSFLEEADKKQNLDLQNQCIQFIGENLKTGTLMQFLDFATKKNHSKLLVVCLDFIINNAKSSDLLQLLNNKACDKKKKSILQCGISIADIHSEGKKEPLSYHCSIYVTFSDSGDIRAKVNLYYCTSCDKEKLERIQPKICKILKELNDLLSINDFVLNLSESDFCREIFKKKSNPHEHTILILNTTKELETFFKSLNTLTLNCSVVEGDPRFSIKLSKIDQNSSNPNEGSSSQLTALLEIIKSNPDLIADHGLGVAVISNLFKLLPNLEEIAIDTSFLKTFKEVKKYVNLFAGKLRSLNLRNVYPAIDDHQIKKLKPCLDDIRYFYIKSNKLTKLNLPRVELVRYRDCPLLNELNVPDDAFISPACPPQERELEKEINEATKGLLPQMNYAMRRCWPPLVNRLRLKREKGMWIIRCGLIKEPDSTLRKKVSIILNNGDKLDLPLVYSVIGLFRQLNNNDPQKLNS